jgi:hypothetical protein
MVGDMGVWIGMRTTSLTISSNTLGDAKKTNSTALT